MSETIERVKDFFEANARKIAIGVILLGFAAAATYIDYNKEVDKEAALKELQKKGYKNIILGSRRNFAKSNCELSKVQIGNISFSATVTGWPDNSEVPVTGTLCRNPLNDTYEVQEDWNSPFSKVEL